MEFKVNFITQTSSYRVKKKCKIAQAYKLGKLETFQVCNQLCFMKTMYIKSSKRMNSSNIPCPVVNCPFHYCPKEAKFNPHLYHRHSLRGKRETSHVTPNPFEKMSSYLPTFVAIKSFCLFFK